MDSGHAHERAFLWFMQDRRARPLGYEDMSCKGERPPRCFIELKLFDSAKRGVPAYRGSRDEHFPPRCGAASQGALQGLSGPSRCQHHTLRKICFFGATVCVSGMLKAGPRSQTPKALPASEIRKNRFCLPVLAGFNVSSMLRRLLAGPQKIFRIFLQVSPHFADGTS